MTSYGIQDFQRITGARLEGSPWEGQLLYLLTDSRQPLYPAKSLFVALKGERHDGHRYLAEAYGAGVRCFLVSELPATLAPHACYLVVPDTLGALQQLASWHRHRFDLHVVGITGSNGKTIVKEWLWQLLNDDIALVRNPASYNSQVGVPLSLWQIQAKHKLGIFEAGLSKPGEIQRLAPLIDCHTGIFTNLGEAHAANFESAQQKLVEKLQLFVGARTVIYGVDDALVHQTMLGFSGKQLLTWSLKGAPATLSLQHAVATAQGNFVELQVLYQGQPYTAALPFGDDASIANAMTCWLTLIHLGYDPAEAGRRLHQLVPVAMRLERKAGIQNTVIINDTYNADLNSLEVALHFLEQQSHLPKKTLIISDLLQSDLEAEALYRRVAGLLENRPVDRIIGIGQAVEALAHLLPAGIEQHWYPDTSALLKDWSNLQFANESILIKGARIFELERVANLLTSQAHQTVLEVNLSAVAHNLRTYASLLKPGVKMLSMVKAAGYGSGTYEVARTLEFHRVDYLGVAYADEGVELRKHGIKTPILVLNPEEVAFPSILQYQLEPQLYSIAVLKQFLQWLKPGDRFPVHLELDTGMHRLGFQTTEMEALGHLLEGNDQIVVKSIMSHLSASESSEHDAFTHEQARRFMEGYDYLCSKLGYRPWRHLLNSAGIERFPEYQWEMVRLGIGLYGIESSPLLERQLQAVCALKARVSQVLEIAPGETVGYGRRAKDDHSRRIATLSIGYADGLWRRAGGRHQVMIRGELAPLLGVTCMDMCMADVSHLPQVQAGDVVQVFGAQWPIQHLADALETIPYEILTGISSRVKRVYFQE